jgi:hypothetical protein
VSLYKVRSKLFKSDQAVGGGCKRPAAVDGGAGGAGWRELDGVARIRAPGGQTLRDQDQNKARELDKKDKPALNFVWKTKPSKDL